MGNWKNKHEYYQKALARLDEAVNRNNDNDRQLQDGLIQRFEFTFELAWKTLKDYFKAVDVNVIGPMDSIEQAFADEITMDGETWQKMEDASNKTTHT